MDHDGLLDASAAGRSTQGVKLINLGPGDTIGSIECLATIEDAEDAGKVATILASPESGDGKDGK